MIYIKRITIALLAASSSFGQWQATPTTAVTGLNAILDAKPAVRAGSGYPLLSCTQGKDFYLDISASPAPLYYCDAANHWTRFPAAISGAPNSWPNTFAPSAHAGTHAAGQSDALVLSQSQITDLVSALAAKLTDPLTTRGDLMVRGASGTTRLGLGSNGKCLLSDGTDAYWGTCALTTLAWGSITGLLSNQTDLSLALAGKQAAISGAPGTWPSSFTPSAHASSHGSGQSDAVTLAESQVTSLVSDLAGKLSDPLTTRGDIVYRGASGTTRLAIGSTGKCLLSDGVDAYWGTCSLGFTPLNAASNLSDLTNTTTARTNLGLGTAATQASTAFAPATSGSAVLKGNGSGGFANAAAGTDYQAVISGAPGAWPTFYYQLLGVGSTSQTARNRINLIAGTNVTITPSDNSGTNSTDITIAAAGGGGGSGSLVVTVGSGAPAASCAGPTSSNLAVYADTANGNIYACTGANVWKKVLATTDSGTYQVTGATGTAPSAPSSGNVTCYFSSTSNTQICLDSSGNAFSAVKTGTATSHQFLTNIGTDGVPVKAQPADADIAFTDVTTGNASSSMHGFVPRLPNDNTKCFLGDGSWTACPGGASGATTNQNYRYIRWTLDGGGSALTAVTGCQPVDFSGTINQVTATADVSGSITLDLKTVAHASYTGPASTSSITNSNPAAMSSAAALTVSAATMATNGWITTLSAGSDMCIVASSPSTMTRLSVAVRVSAN